HQAYDSWKSVSHPEVSKTGQLIHYQITPQEGDALFELKNKDNSLIFSHARATDAKLTQDETFLIAKIKPTFAETRQAKIEKKKASDMPKDSLVIVNIQSKEQWKVPEVSSYRLAQNKNEYIAFLTAEKKDSTKTPAILHLKNLLTGDTLNFWRADQYAWSPNEEYLIFSKKTDDKDSLSTDAGLYLYDLAGKNLKRISNGRGDYKSLHFDDHGTQFAFLADKTPEKSLVKDFKLYYYTPQLDTAHILASQQSTGIPAHWQVSGNGTLKFSADGQKLFFGLAPVPSVKDTSLVDFEHAQVDIWHWKDDYVQPQQLANLNREKNRSFLTVVYPKNGNRILPLVDETFGRTTITDEANNEWILA